MSWTESVGFQRVILDRIGGIPEGEHGVVAVGHAPVVGELTLAGADPLGSHFEDVGAGLVDAASG